MKVKNTDRGPNHIANAGPSTVMVCENRALAGNSADRPTADAVQIAIWDLERVQRNILNGDSDEKIRNGLRNVEAQMNFIREWYNKGESFIRKPKMEKPPLPIHGVCPECDAQIVVKDGCPACDWKRENERPVKMARPELFGEVR